jgi:two-component system sensor kinase FixL
MTHSISHNQRMIYLAVITIWLLLLITLMSSIVAFDLHRARTRFNESANLRYQQANNQVQIIETILEGFAAMVSVANDPGRERIRSYAQKMLEKYPYIFMFEIVEKVSQVDLDSFVEYYRRNIYPDFEVKGFSYESDRKWQPLSDRPFHLPIVFMEPFPEQSRKVMGLDLSSNAFFMQALRESETRNGPASSDPFRLVEGPLAYIIHRPVPVAEKQIHSHSINSGATVEFAVLVVRADTLLAADSQQQPGMHELLYKASYNEADPEGYLQVHATPAAGWLESKIFPYLRTRMELDSASQPFILLVEQQLGWGIVSWGKLGLALLAALFTFSVMLAYARLYFRNEMARAERYLQISRAMIVGLDRDGNINLINRRGCEILGYRLEELLGRNWFETVIPEKHRDEVYANFRKIIAGEIEPLRKYENNILTKDGATRHIDWNNDVEKDPKGEITGTLSSGQDITERKRAEENLLRQQRDMAHVLRLGTMGEMATGMAHELNQPLTAIVSYCGSAATLVKKMPSPPEKLAEILTRAMEQAHRAGGIIRHLRKLVSKEEVTNELFNLDQVIRGVINLLKSEVQDCGAIIRLFPGVGSHKTTGDQIQIEQVLVNVVRNSLEAIRNAGIPDGRVVIKTRLLEDGIAEVTIADNGPGLDAALAEKVFEPFQSGKKTGMGIGLSLSRTIIENHGGKLWVDKNYRNGALFGFKLPVVD